VKEQLRTGSWLRMPRELSLRALGSVWLEEWKSERIENEKGMEKWDDRRDLVFFHLCLVGRMEKWRDGKLICGNPR